MKKTVGILFACLCLVACNSNTKPVSDDDIKNMEYKNYADSLIIDDVQKVSMNAEHAIAISDVEKLRDFEMNVFIGTIDSIDGCSTTIANGTFNPTPFVYGKMTVLKNLKGETDGSVINFARHGGIISIADYEKDAPEEMILNNEKHRKEAGQEDIDKSKTYLDFQYEEDIILEAGKTYLFFSMYDATTKYYAIDGVQYGTREIYQPSTESHVFKTMPEVSTLQIKNNETGEYEPFDDFMNTYFK